MSFVPLDQGFESNQKAIFLSFSMQIYHLIFLHNTYSFHYGIFLVVGDFNAFKN